MLDFVLDAITGRPVTYVILAAVVLVDDFVPFAPGDTAMITAGVLAANDALLIWLVIAAGTAGGIAGDNVFYLLGRRFGPRLAHRLVRGDRGRRLYDGVERQLGIRGATIVLVGRFIPAGRTATTFACGTVGFPYRRFLWVDAAAALAWAGYTALLGYVGGSTFRDALWQPVLIGLGVAFALGLAAELVVRGRDGAD